VPTLGEVRRILTVSLVAAAVLLPATAAQGAGSLIATVRGFGHGVGLSQYGTLGYAQHGWTADRILAHYYTGTQLGRLGSAPIVRVLLQNTRSSYAISGASSVGGQLLDRSKTYTVVRGRDGLIVRDGSKDLFTSAGPMLLRPASGGAVTLAGPAQNGTSGGAYRGGIEVGIGAGGLTAINVLSLEDYVAGVVSAEVPASWPDQALRAQAVAARTYAVTTNAGGSAGNFTQYADTRSQMYRGVAAETPTTGAAVRATAGRVVTYQGKPVATFFFSSSGGRTENVENSFVGSDPKPWLKSVLDPYDTVSPYHRPQTFRWTLTRATRSLGGLVKGRLKQIRVTKRGVSPRIVRADVVGTAGTTTVTGPQLRRAFGLRDTWIRFRSFSTDVSKQPAPPVGGQLPSVPSIPRTTPVDPTTGGAQTAAAGLRIHGVIAPATAGAWASVERRVGARWERAVDVQVARGGAYATTLPGPGTYRVRYAGQSGPVVTTAR
jgi:stage II sporulation protein D